MAEYIDREALLELINEDCKYQNPTNEYTRGCNEVCDWAIKTIENMPTADVVPKSEVEELITLNSQLEATTFGQREEIKKLETALRRSLPSYYQVCSEEQAMKIGYEKGKSELAKEIFTEIEKWLGDYDGLKIITLEKYFAVKEKYTEGNDV